MFKYIHTTTTIFSGPGDMRFVSCRAFEPTACDKMLMLQETACPGNR
jgi:hypothetical protein